MDENTATLTLNITVTLKPEALETDNGITAAQKEETMKQLIIDQVNAIAPNYDWGIAVEGTLNSSLTDTVDFDISKPDYTEQ